MLSTFEFGLGLPPDASGWNDYVKPKSGDCCGWKACVTLLSMFVASDEKPPPVLSPLEALALGSNVCGITLYIRDAGSKESLPLLGSPNDDEKPGDWGGGV